MMTDSVYKPESGKLHTWGIVNSSMLWMPRLLRVPWTSGRSNQSILKEISPEYSLEGLMLRLKLQYFGHMMWRTDSLENTLMLGKIEGGREGHDRGWDGWMASLTQWTWVWVNSRGWWFTGKSDVLLSMGLQSWTQLRNWTDECRWCSLLQPACDKVQQADILSALQEGPATSFWFPFLHWPARFWCY